MKIKLDQKNFTQLKELAMWKKLGKICQGEIFFI